MRILPFKAIFPDVKRIKSVDEFYDAMKEEFPLYNKDGWFVEESSPALYIYKIEGVGYHHYGLVSATDVRDALEGHIVRHEDTLPDKEAQMLELSLERGAMIKPVLLFHESVQMLNDFIQQWTASHDSFQSVYFSQDLESHTLWQISQTETILFLKDLFHQQIDKAYIGDGHHRSEISQLLFKSEIKERVEASRMLTVYFAVSEIKIFAFNRIIEFSKELSQITFLQELSAYFHIREMETFTQPVQKHELVLLMDNKHYLLNWKEAYLDLKGKEHIVLDTYLLEKHVLKALLGISDVRNDHRIHYVPALETAAFYQNMVAAKKDAIAFLLYPIEPSDLIAIADAGNTIPPKSTWFQPRIKNAFISLSINQ